MTLTPTRRFGVTAKFVTAITVLLLSVLAVAGVATSSLNRTRRHSEALFGDHLETTQRTDDLTVALYRLGAAALLRAGTQAADERSRRDTVLDAVDVPRVQAALSSLRAVDADDPEELRELDTVAAGLRQYATLRAAGAGAPQVLPVFDRLTATAQGLRDREVRLSSQSLSDLGETGRAAQRRLTLAVGVTLLLGLLVALALIRSQVPRISRYARYADEVAAGRRPAPLQVHGSDELAVLGRALDALVLQQERREAQERRQTEFVETLQVTSTEQEAHELLEHHLDRSLAGSSARVLQRNNSANRLQAATGLGQDDPLVRRLLGAEPRSCLAVRSARTHQEAPDVERLLPCQLCSDRTSRASCEPLLVAGEVIGSVLVTHPEVLTAAEEACIRTTVGQAAPVLANLRNLALAEFRANSDSLTGLPNRRATDDTLKRMVAHANRTLTSLVAVMLDLDHFKQINDRFGHGRGDEVLAAVGSVLQAGLRASDFAGRFGGEEFLVLLPSTDLTGAAVVTENLRAAIATITVPGVERDITASLGAADLLAAGTAAGLLQAADQALYAAKAAGRNRVVLSDGYPAVSAAPAG